MTELLNTVGYYAKLYPEVPISWHLSVKDYNALEKLIDVYPSTPCRMAYDRFRVLMGVKDGRD